MKTIYLIFCLLISTCLFSQSADSLKTVIVDTQNSRDSIGIFQNVEVEAEFPGGIEAWKNFLYTNLRADAPFKDLPKKVNILSKPPW